MLRADARLLDRQQRRTAEVLTRTSHRSNEFHDALVRQHHVVLEHSGTQQFVRPALLRGIARIDAVNQYVRINEACHGYTDPLYASLARAEARVRSGAASDVSCVWQRPRRRAAAAPP